MHVQAWDVSSLKLVMEVKAAHDGERIQALVMGPSSTPAASSSSSTLSSAGAEPASASNSVGSDDDGGGSSNISAPLSTDAPGTAGGPQSAAAAAGVCPVVPAASSPSAVTILYSGGDDKLVRRWDARLLTPAGPPLQLHSAAVKALAVGERDLLLSGDAAGEVAVWSV